MLHHCILCDLCYRHISIVQLKSLVENDADRDALKGLTDAHIKLYEEHAHQSREALQEVEQNRIANAIGAEFRPFLHLKAKGRRFISRGQLTKINRCKSSFHYTSISFDVSLFVIITRLFFKKYIIVNVDFENLKLEELPILRC